MDKLALSLFLKMASRKLRPFSTIQVFTNFPLKQVLQKLNASERLLKWVVGLSEFDIVFKLRTIVKGQILADFVAEFTLVPEMEEEMESVEPPTWNLFVDGSSRDIGSRAKVILVCPKG